MIKKIVSFLAAFMIALPVQLIVMAAEEKKPDVHAFGAIIMEMDTGRVLWEKDAHKKLAMASTTKIMTAILALELGNMSDKVTVTKRAAAAPRVKMDLTTNEVILLGDLLYALMLQSSNDAAVAIAEHIGGTVEDFCEMMTDKARSIGAYNTVYETPNGLDSENHYSTAYDLAIIADYALQNPEFVKLINTRSHYATSDKRSYDISNKNRLLSEYEGAFGVKTGFTGKAGHCFVGAAERDGMRIITVALGSGWGADGKERKWTDTKQMMNYAFKSFSYETVVNEGLKAGDIQINRSKTKTMDVYFPKNIVLPLSEEEKGSIVVEVSLPDELYAPVVKDTHIGNASVYSNGELLAVSDLYTGQDIERHDLKASAEKVLEAFIKLVTNSESNINLPEF